jgi:hypothetical protein
VPDWIQKRLKGQLEKLIFQVLTDVLQDQSIGGTRHSVIIRNIPILQNPIEFVDSNVSSLQSNSAKEVCSWRSILCEWYCGKCCSNLNIQAQYIVLLHV